MLEFLLEVVFEGVISWLLLKPLGFLYLQFRYCTKARRAQQLSQRYDNDYANAGRDAAINVFAGVFILLLLALLIGVPLAHWMAA